MGADPQSRVFYNRTKGELERELMRLELRTVYAFRPSLLVGERAEFRAGERAALALARPLAFLLPPKVRPVAAADVARAMHACGRRTAIGRFVILSDEIRRIAAKSQFLRLGSSTSPQF
jgi:uncharacterized protein YbjT (DUF2867 family)